MFANDAAASWQYLIDICSPFTAFYHSFNKPDLIFGFGRALVPSQISASGLLARYTCDRNMQYAQPTRLDTPRG